MGSQRLIIRHLMAVALMVFIAGCEAQATPVPVADNPEPSPAINGEVTNMPSDQLTETPSLRYGLTPNSSTLDAFIPDDATVTIDTLSDPTRFDILLTWGVVDGWEVSPVSWQGTMVLNQASPQLNNTETLNLLEMLFDGDDLLSAQGINGTSLSDGAIDTITARTALANLGYPDGIVLRLAANENSPISALSNYLEAFNIRTVILPVPDDISSLLEVPETFDLLFITAPESDSLLTSVDTLSIVPLYTIPISYVNNTNQPVTFNSAGIPIIDPADS